MAFWTCGIFAFEKRSNLDPNTNWPKSDHADKPHLFITFQLEMAVIYIVELNMKIYIASLKKCVLCLRFICIAAVERVVTCKLVNHRQLDRKCHFNMFNWPSKSVHNLQLPHVLCINLGTFLCTPPPPPPPPNGIRGHLVFVLSLGLCGKLRNFKA